eukprot:4932058-Prymnesium_polylepis.1
MVGVACLSIARTLRTVSYQLRSQLEDVREAELAGGLSAELEACRDAAGGVTLQPKPAHSETVFSPRALRS